MRRTAGTRSCTPPTLSGGTPFGRPAAPTGRRGLPAPASTAPDRLNVVRDSDICRRRTGVRRFYVTGIVLCARDQQVCCEMFQLIGAILDRCDGCHL